MDGASVKFKVLQADHSISCESPAYEKWKGYAWIMVLIYPVGIPCWYLLELLWWRKAINPDVDERRHNLTSKYQPVWKSSSELGYPGNYTDLCEPPRHPADAVTATTSRRWPENSTPSSRRSYGDSIASMAWGARNLISTQATGRSATAGRSLKRQ